MLALVYSMALIRGGRVVSAGRSKGLFSDPSGSRTARDDAKTEDRLQVGAHKKRCETKVIIVS